MTNSSLWLALVFGIFARSAFGADEPTSEDLMWQFGTICLPLVVEVQEPEESDDAALLAEALKDNASKRLSSYGVVIEPSGETDMRPMLLITLSVREQHNFYGLGIAHFKWVIDLATGQVRSVPAWRSELTFPQSATDLFNEFERLLDQFLARYTAANTAETCTRENAKLWLDRLHALARVGQ